MHLGGIGLQSVVHIFPLPSGLSQVYFLHSFGSHVTHSVFIGHNTAAQLVVGGAVARIISIIYEKRGKSIVKYKFN